MPGTQLALGRLVAVAIDLRRPASRREGQALVEYAPIVSLKRLTR